MGWPSCERHSDAIRSLDEGEKVRLKRYGVGVHTMSEVDRHGIEQGMKEALARVSDGRQMQALLPIPGQLPRFVPLPESISPQKGLAFVFLEDIIRANMQELFPGTQVKSAHLFRVIRDADLEFDQEEADDLLETVDRSLKQLRHGAIALALEVPRRRVRIAPHEHQLANRERKR